MLGPKNTRQTAARIQGEIHGEEGQGEEGQRRARTGGGQPIEPGLHLIATPIGSARDITLRALDLLAGADLLAAEDTRSLRRLMDMHGVALRGRPLLAYHDHNGEKMRPRLLSALGEGLSVAYAAEAGTPMVADPGYRLAVEAIAAGFAVHSAPGASAVLAALTVSGLPSDRFCFMGFAPTQKGARARFLAEAAAVPATVILFESPKRVRQMLDELVQHFGEERQCALCRELTKRHQEVIRGTLGALQRDLAGRVLRGEIVLVIDRARSLSADPEALARALRAALETQSLREAVAYVAAAHGAPRREVYQLALEISGRD